jgi:radical SAM protein with 4Fe4S-binding SPASM domain
MESTGSVHKLYPFLGVAHSLLLKEPNLLRCGGGWINYAIQTDGFIIPCPTMWGMKNYYLGHISNADPLELRKIFISDKPCTECSIFNICGGRCLYANITKRWKNNEYATVCITVRSLVNAVEAQLPRITQLIKNGKIRQQDFEFMKYNGCEIIP